MADDKKGGSGVIVLRARSTMVTAPGILGWSNLLKADDKFGDPVFQLNLHWTPEQVEQFIAQVERYAIEPFFQDLLTESKRSNLKRPDAREFVEDHLKEAKEGARQQLPFYRFKRKEEVRRKDGSVSKVKMAAWGADNAPLNLEKLALGMGSVVQAVVTPCLFVSALLKKPEPTFQLAGVRVLKLERYEGGSAGPSDITEEDLSTLSSDFQADDLSAYMGGSDKEPAKGLEADDAFALEKDLPF